MIIFSLSIIIGLNIKETANIRIILFESNQINCPEFLKSSVKFFVLYVFPIVIASHNSAFDDKIGECK